MEHFVSLTKASLALSLSVSAQVYLRSFDSRDFLKESQALKLGIIIQAQCMYFTLEKLFEFGRTSVSRNIIAINCFQL
jgi:hypothetical protein